MKSSSSVFWQWSAVLVFGLWGYLRLGLAEIQADVHAPAWERQLMNFAVHASVRRSAGKAQKTRCLPRTRP